MRGICLIDEGIPTLNSLKSTFLLMVIIPSVQTEKQYPFYFLHNTA